LLADFDIASEINHNGSKGTYRENSLKKFLSDGRLPIKYGIGSGEIVSPANDVTNQCDLIIYDKFEGIPLIYDESTQVYPIDTIYGVIEVKSQLSKEKLVEALNNIKSIKSIVPNDYISRQTDPFIKTRYRRPKPCGLIFAYSLSNNSLDSLIKNLKEWESSNPPEYWPNLIVILNEGIIYHIDNKLKNCYSNDSITCESSPITIYHRGDSLFYFYSVLLDLINNIYLVPPSLNIYFNLPQKMGEYNVKNHDRFCKFGKDKKVKEDKIFRLTYTFIDKVVKWCIKSGKLTNRELYIKQFGQLPHGCTEKELGYSVYLYNPDNLSGPKNINESFKRDEEGNMIATEKLLAPSTYIEVNGEVFYIPQIYIEKNDLEEIPGKKYEDLF